MHLRVKPRAAVRYLVLTNMNPFHASNQIKEGSRHTPTRLAPYMAIAVLRNCRQPMCPPTVAAADHNFLLSI